MASFANGFFVEKCAASGDSPLACIPSGASSCTGEGCMACTSALGIDGFCGEIGLDEGGDSLQLLLGHSGDLGKKLFALGVLAAGQASTMTGTFAGQYVMEGFLDIRIPIWIRTLFTRSIALGPAVVVALMTADNPNLNNTVNQWLNILQSVQLPFALLPVLHFCSDRNLMGQFALKRRWQALCWGLALIVISVNVYLVLLQLVGQAWYVWLCGVVFFLAYGGFISVIIRSDLRRMFGGLCGFLSGRPRDVREAGLPLNS